MNVKVACCDGTTGRDRSFCPAFASDHTSNHTPLSPASSLLNVASCVSSSDTTPACARLPSETLQILDLYPTGVTTSPRPPAKSHPRRVSRALAPASSCSRARDAIKSQTGRQQINIFKCRPQSRGPTLTNTPAKRCAASAFSSVFAL